MIRTFHDVLTHAIALPDRRIAIAKAEEPDVLEAVDLARRLGIASAVLVGEDAAIRRELGRLGIDAAPYEIVDAPSREEASEKAVRMVSDGYADTLMKGAVDTSILLHAVLNRDWGLRTDSILSHVALFEVATYPKLLAMTDGGMLMYPDVEQKAAAIRNALVVTRALGVQTAKVAALAAKEKVNPKMQATVDAADLAARHWDGAIVEGPIALDGAVSAIASATKGIHSQIAGDVDLLLVPAIEVGNVFYKTLMYFARAQAAGIVVGARRPIVLTSRSDHEDTKLNSIALAMVVADQQARDRQGALCAS